MLVSVAAAVTAVGATLGTGLIVAPPARAIPAVATATATRT
ncbi:hypothetical protein [Streptomyces sp. NPDC058612]